MNTMKNYLKYVLLAIAFMLTGASAYKGYLDRQNHNDALAMTNTNISLSQAIAIAEQHSAGIAARGDFNQSDQTPFYEIDVLSNGKVFTVKVDIKGELISATEKRESYDEESYDTESYNKESYDDKEYAKR